MHIEQIARDHGKLGVPVTTDGLATHVHVACADGGFDKVTWALQMTGVAGAYTVQLQGAFTAAGPWFTLDSFSDAADATYANQVIKMPLMRLNVTVGTSFTVNSWVAL